jgi:hypothetical protein
MDNRLTMTKPAAKPKPRHPDRITLVPAHLEKIDGWIRQVTARQRGVRLTRNDIISWLIDSQPVELPPKDEKQLGERHYDEERFLKEAIREIKARKARGEVGSLTKLLKEWTSRPTADRPAAKPRRRKVKVETAPNEQTTLEGGPSALE